MKVAEVENIKRNIPVDEELALHKKGWIIQRIGWVLLYTFLLLAVLGLFGEGVLSNRSATSGNINLTYDRFNRYEHETELKFRTSNENIVHVMLPAHFLAKFKISKIVPEPDKQVASGGFVDYIFLGNENKSVTFYVDPIMFGSFAGTIRVNNNDFFLKQTIFP